MVVLDHNVSTLIKLMKDTSYEQHIRTFAELNTGLFLSIALAHLGWPSLSKCFS